MLVTASEENGELASDPNCHLRGSQWLVHSGNENAFFPHGEGVIEAQDLSDDRSWVIIRLPLLLIAPLSNRC